MPNPAVFGGASRQWWVVLLFALSLPALMSRVVADEPKMRPPLTAAQQARLKERDRYAAEAEKLWMAGKQAEAVAAWERKIAIEREVLGKTHEEVAKSLEQLASLQERREDLPLARKTRLEVVEIRTQLHGETDWQVTNARLALANLDRLAPLDAGSRQRLGEASAMVRRAERLYREGR